MEKDTDIFKALEKAALERGDYSHLDGLSPITTLPEATRPISADDLAACKKDIIGCAFESYENWEKFVSEWLSKQTDPNNYDDNFQAWWDSSSILDRIPLYAMICEYIAKTNTENENSNT